MSALPRVAVGLAALLTAAAQPAPAQPQPQRGGKLVFAVDSEPANYDCHANVSFAFLHPVAPHYSTLLKFDTARYPAILGDLAESWTVSSDRMTYTFKLRPNVLFHDGTRLTSADVKASYQRIAHPPPGVVSARQADYASVAAIDTPNPRIAVFHLQWPDAAMLANFASPWNCIYSAARLQDDPQFPRTHVMGTGPFTFVEHVKGQHWIGKRFDRYFLPGRPYLDGYEAQFIAGAPVIQALESGRVMAEFRSVTPVERDELVRAMGSRIQVYESPWLIDLLLVFNTHENPFDDERIRRALSLAIDRWQMAEQRAGDTFLKFVGGLMRPGSTLGTPEAQLTDAPGFSHDITASRAMARKLLAEAGVPNLAFTLTNRDVPIPYGPAAEDVIAAWRDIGVTVTEQKLNTRDWQAALEGGKFAVAFDFGGDYFDDPTLQLAKYVSRDLSPSNYAASSDRVLDGLYIGQALATDPRQRLRIVHEFERVALTQAYTVPILWWNRIVVTASAVKGWNMTPSHYIGQDLTDVRLER
jgi:peptide/nickel transport system substrate-binding protein